MGAAVSLDRWLYRGSRPNRIARVANHLWWRLSAAGVGPPQWCALEVRGRRSGTVVRLPLVVAEHDGDRYLVSMLGEDVNWVRNVRAAQGFAVLRHGEWDVVHLDEVDAADRAPILRRYLAVAPGARPHIAAPPDAALEEFERIASRHPVFRVHTVDRAGSRLGTPTATARSPFP